MAVDPAELSAEAADAAPVQVGRDQPASPEVPTAESTETRTRLVGISADFIRAAWNAFLSPESPDSFQPRTLDLILLVQELHRVCVLAKGNEQWAAHLKHIAEEIGETARKESVFLKSHPYLDTALRSVVEDVKQGAKVKKLEKALDVIRRLEPDVSALGQDLVALSSTNEKERFLHRVSTVITHIHFQGLAAESRAALLAVSDEQAAAPIIDALVAPLRKATRVFTCYLAIDDARSAVWQASRTSEFKRVRPSMLKNNPESSLWVADFKDRTLLQVDIPAVSSTKAAETALTKVSTYLNLFNLYVNASVFRANTRILVVDNNVFSVEDIKASKYFGLFPRSNYQAKAALRYRQAGEHLSGRLSNALECYSLALGSADSRTAIINLWTAMETITGSIGSTNIGERVAEKLAPVVAMRRMDKIITYLAFSAHKHIQARKLEVDETILPVSTANRIAPDDVLTALTGPSGNAQIMHFFKLLTDAPLLVHRFFAVWSEFNEPKKLGQALRQSEQRVAWQIFRIYRARNIVVHTGEQDQLVLRLLQNAQYYVSTVVARILRDFDLKKSWDLDVALAHEALRYNYLSDRLVARAGEGLTFGDILDEKSRTADRLVWPSAPQQ